MILPESVLKMIPILDKYEVGAMDPVVTHGWLVAMAQELIEYRLRIEPYCPECGRVFKLNEVPEFKIPTHDHPIPVALHPAMPVCPGSGEPIRRLDFRHPSLDFVPGATG